VLTLNTLGFPSLDKFRALDILSAFLVI